MKNDIQTINMFNDWDMQKSRRGGGLLEEFIVSPLIKLFQLIIYLSLGSNSDVEKEIKSMFRNSNLI